jgi:hypothetical protein
VKNSKASALLLVFAISFFLTFFAMRCWYHASLICDIQSQRELYYKQFYLAEKILDSGINLVCKNFDNFLKFKVSVNADPGVDELAPEFVAEFIVSKVPKKDKLFLTANLIEQNEVRCSLRCTLERKKRQDTINETCFIVDNFTLSSSL